MLKAPTLVSDELITPDPSVLFVNTDVPLILYWSPLATLIPVLSIVVITEPAPIISTVWSPESRTIPPVLVLTFKSPVLFTINESEPPW